jgi:hypothetical protein
VRGCTCITRNVSVVTELGKIQLAQAREDQKEERRRDQRAIESRFRQCGSSGS